MFGILVVAADELELVEAALVEPAAQQVVVEPGAPRALHGHARPHGEHAQDQIGADERGKEQGLARSDRSVPGLERIEEVPIPQIDAVRDAQADEDDNDEAY